MKKTLLVVSLVLLGGITITSVMAASFQDENVIVRRDNTGTSSITVQNTGSSGVIKLQDLDNPQIYQIRLTGDGSRLDIVDVTNNRVGFAMKSDTGNVGIGTTAPTEKLDVNGNLRVRGNIVSTSDICIGNCP